MTSHTLRHLLLAIALIGSFAAPLLGKGGALQAQTPDNDARYITGTISDKSTGEALAGVTVSTWQNSKLLTSVFTDLEGNTGSANRKAHTNCASRPSVTKKKLSYRQRTT